MLSNVKSDAKAAYVEQKHEIMFMRVSWPRMIGWRANAHVGLHS